MSQPHLLKRLLQKRFTVLGTVWLVMLIASFVWFIHGEVEFRVVAIFALIASIGWTSPQSRRASSK